MPGSPSLSSRYWCWRQGKSAALRCTISEWGHAAAKARIPRRLIEVPALTIDVEAETR